MIAVPRALIAGGSLRFDFKWVDDVAAEGDAAPSGRFNYPLLVAR